MSFSVLYWNIWLENQIHGKNQSGALLAELRRLTSTYQPDFIGLCEVLQQAGTKKPFVTEFLKNECDYKYGYFAPASPLDDNWLIGVGLYSNIKPTKVWEATLSKDSPADRRGYTGCEVKALAAHLQLNTDRTVTLVVAHPLHLRLHTLKDHYRAIKKLENLLRLDHTQNTIVGGDLNEPGFMPRGLRHRVRDRMHMRSGTFTNMTWRHNAQLGTPLRANLDHIYWSKSSDFELESFAVLPSKVSDHRPILATFRTTPGLRKDARTD